MAKTPTLPTNVHLSENFGGIKTHGDEVRDYKRGQVAEFKNDNLADYLIASELKVAK